LTLIEPTQTTTTTSDARDLVATRFSEASNPRIYFDQQITLTSTIPAADVQRPPVNEDRILASLSPIARLRYLAGNNKAELVVSILALFGGVYIFIAALSHFGSVFDKWFSLSASAQAGSPTAKETAVYSSTEMLQWYVALLMGVSLLCAWGMTMFARQNQRSLLGKTLSK
jgi:hypothetical protein